MKEFYGGVFIEREKLISSGIEYPIKLEYYKTKNVEENNEFREIFGINIVKKEYKEKVNIEEEKIEYITDDEEHVNKILDIFKNNEVTPVSAKYIIEDMFKDL